MGNTALADNIVEFLNKGYFSWRSFGSGDTRLANTTAFNDIELDPQVVGTDVSFEGKAYYVIHLAAILTHEKRHAHQHWWDKISESNKENDAWTTEILEVDDWIHVLYMKYLKSHKPEDKSWVSAAVDYKLKQGGAFVR